VANAFASTAAQNGAVLGDAQNEDMRITTLTVANFRSFVQMEPIEHGQINVFMGPNNAGKSSLLRAAYAMQQGGTFAADVRLGAARASINIRLSGLANTKWEIYAKPLGEAVLDITIEAGGDLTLVLDAVTGGTLGRRSAPRRVLAGSANDST
jgi:hypothetical protein